MPILRAWAAHPWVAWWLSLVPLLYSPDSPPPILRPIHWGGAFVWCASLVQGLRVTGRRSVVTAGLIAAALFVPDLAPMLGAGGTRLLEYALGVTLPRAISPAPLLFGAVVLAAFLVEVAARRTRGPGAGAAAAAGAGLPAWLRKLGTGGAVLFLLVASMAVKIGWAKQQTHSLCAETVVGEPVERFDARARDRGLIVWSSAAGTDAHGQPRPGLQMGWEGFGFARHFCNVEHADGRILSKRTSFLD